MPEHSMAISNCKHRTSFQSRKICLDKETILIRFAGIGNLYTLLCPICVLEFKIIRKTIVILFYPCRSAQLINTGIGSLFSFLIRRIHYRRHTVVSIFRWQTADVIFIERLVALVIFVALPLFIAWLRNCSFLHLVIWRSLFIFLCRGLFWSYFQFYIWRIFIWEWIGSDVLLICSWGRLLVEV